MRVVKEHNERRNEILDVAGKLFAIKGYEKCTVNDILKEIGIAKGTFYYYFKSKEEILDAIIMRVTDMIVERAAEAAENAKLTPEIKLLSIFMSMQVKSEVGDEIADELHQPENALMQQKSLNSIIKGVTPILTAVIDEGIAKGVFHTDFPRQYMQIFLLSTSVFLDAGTFQVEPEEQQEMLRALIALLEKMLGIADESMWEVARQHWNMQ